MLSKLFLIIVRMHDNFSTSVAVRSTNARKNTSGRLVVPGDDVVDSQ